MGDETATAATEGSAPEPRTRYGLGLCGLALGVLGLTLALARPHVAEILEPPPEPRPKLSEVLAEAGERFVDRMVDRARGRAAAPRVESPPEPPPAARPWLLSLSAAATALGLAGSLSVTAGWIRREDSRLAGGAIAVGALAVAWIYLVAALAMALAIVFLVLLSSALGWNA